ncbi:MAG: DoxX family membrane protein [Chitinophagaceae bacterium]|nr:MAG: DoxX family membrane protein [Chitinophagaceae bacterium]
MPSNTSRDISQLLLRVFISLGFIFPVLDRLGYLGAAGVNGNAWGNWNNFIGYTQTLMPYFNQATTSVMGTAATILEALFAIGLLLGFKTRLMAIGSGLLTFAFAVSMLLFADYRAPLTYSVFVVSFASFLLASLRYHKWSIDSQREKFTRHDR